MEAAVEAVEVMTVARAVATTAGAVAAAKAVAIKAAEIVVGATILLTHFFNCDYLALVRKPNQVEHSSCRLQAIATAISATKAISDPLATSAFVLAAPGPQRLSYCP